MRPRLFALILLVALAPWALTSCFPSQILSPEDEPGEENEPGETNDPTFAALVESVEFAATPDVS